MDLTKFILNSVLISVPESCLLTFISFIFLRKFELFQKIIQNKRFLGVIIFVTIPYAIFSGYSFFYLDYTIVIRLFINILVLSAFIFTYIVTNFIGEDADNNIDYNVKGFFKVVISTFLSVSLLIILENGTLIIFDLLGIDILILSSKSILCNVIFVTPSRLLMLYIIVTAYIKVNNEKEKGGIHNDQKNYKCNY